MTTQPQPVPDDSYPLNWFPQVARANEQRQREQIKKQLEELPIDVLSRALDEARRTEGSGGAS